MEMRIFHFNFDRSNKIISKRTADQLPDVNQITIRETSGIVFCDEPNAPWIGRIQNLVCVIKILKSVDQ